MEFLRPFSLLLILNSFFSIGLILNQNESTKDSTTVQLSSTENPLEKLTWGCFLLQLVLLLIKTKITDI
jgi:hypothetical protein